MLQKLPTLSECLDHFHSHCACLKLAGAGSTLPTSNASSYGYSCMPLMVAESSHHSRVAHRSDSLQPSQHTSRLSHHQQVPLMFKRKHCSSQTSQYPSPATGRSMMLPFTSRQWSILALFITSFSSVRSFQLSMEYRPPVKSSVSKFHDRRGLDSRRFNGATPPSRSPSFQSAHALAYSSGVPPSTGASPSPISSFERRMRNLVLGNPQPTTTTTATIASGRAAPSQKPHNNNKALTGLPHNVHMVHNLREYKELVGDEKHKMVAVRFYATWCRACKAVAPLFYRMALKHPDVVFVEVPVTEQTAALHQGLGVPSLPFGHLYHPQSGLVEEMKLTRKHISAFERKLDCYLQGSCDLANENVWDSAASAYNKNEDTE